MNTSTITPSSINSNISSIFSSYTEILANYLKNKNTKSSLVYPIESENETDEDDKILNDNGLDISSIIITDTSSNEDELPILIYNNTAYNNDDTDIDSDADSDISTIFDDEIDEIDDLDEINYDGNYRDFVDFY
jgi:hypothetical protein